MWVRLLLLVIGVVATGVLGTCGPGQWAATNGTQCLPCPLGTFCPGNDVAYPCPGRLGSWNPWTLTDPGRPEWRRAVGGTWTQGLGADMCSGCNCSPGTFCYLGSGCTACPLGYECPGRVNYSLQVSEEAYPDSSADQDMADSWNSGQWDIYWAALAASELSAWPSDAVLSETSDASWSAIRLDNWTTGSVWPDNTTAAWPCAPGRYAPAYGMASCLSCDCPAGSYCPSARDPLCLPCPPGAWCVDSQARACGATGRWRATGLGGRTDKGEAEPLNATCAACPCGSVGAYCQGTSAQCLVCPPGHQCTGATRRACPAGRFSDTPAATGCEACLCANGTYCHPESSACITCPAGYACRGSAATPCPDGWYALSGASVCSLCPCADGAACDAQTGECSSCPQGSYCVSGASALCATGFWSASGSTGCFQSACPAGWMLALSATEPYECLPCLKGQMCLDGRPIACEAGTYGNVYGASVCNPCSCSAGEYCLGGSSASCLSCPEGSACLGAAATECLCFPGSYCAAATSGNYRDALNATVCVPCPVGLYCALGGPASPQDCLAAPGSYCPIQSVQGSGIPCQGGYWCSGLAAPPLPCACDPGAYCPGGQGLPDCVPCPTGASCPGAASDAVLCGPGTFSPGGAVTCTPCSPGSYGPSLGAARCFPCPAGTWRAEAAGRNVSACTACTPGTSSDLQGLTGPDCPSCVPGKYATASGMLGCLSCPLGTALGGFGATSSNRCIPCGLGTYAPAPGQASCATCGPGRYGRYALNGTSGSAATETSTNVTECAACPVGRFNDVSGSTGPEACAPCPQGSYAADSGSFVCTPCPAGRFARCVAATRLEVCQLCPLGAYCPLGSAWPTVCPAGRFRSYGQGQDPSSPSNGSDLAATAAAAASSAVGCLACPPGAFCPRRAAAALVVAFRLYSNVSDLWDSVTCDPGTGGSTSGDASSDPASGDGGSAEEADGSSSEQQSSGSASWVSDLVAQWMTWAEDAWTSDQGFVDAPGTYYAWDPLPCFPGTYCPQGSSVPLSCPAGSASSSWNWTAEATCVPCMPGRFSDATGQSVCTVCATGSMSATHGATVCAECTAGSYASSDPSAYEAGATTCLACDVGRYNPVAGQALSVACRTCAPGSFGNTTGAQGCTLCPQGTFNALFGATVPTWCLPCGPLTRCDPGSAEPMSTGCDPGTETGTENATLGLCFPCMAGRYCSGGSALSITCPQGAYCPTGTAEPALCAENTASNGTGAEENATCVRCPSGRFAQQGSTGCADCPPGTLGREGQGCTPCPQGTWSGLWGSTSCANCTGTETQSVYRCPPGSAGPLTDAAAQSRALLSLESADTSVTRTWTSGPAVVNDPLPQALGQTDSVLSEVQWAILSSASALSLVLGVAFLLARRGPKGTATLFARCDWLYDGSHVTEVGAEIRREPGEVGGLVTLWALTWVIAVLGLAGAAALDNPAWALSVAPRAPAFAPRGAVRVAATWQAAGPGCAAALSQGQAAGYLATNSSESADQGQVAWVSWSDGWAETAHRQNQVSWNLESLESGSCTVTWHCADCTLSGALGQTQTFVFGLGYRWAYASGLSLSVTLPGLAEANTKAAWGDYEVQQTLWAPAGQWFSGSTATTWRLAWMATSVEGTVPLIGSTLQVLSLSPGSTVTTTDAGNITGQVAAVVILDPVGWSYVATANTKSLLLLVGQMGSLACTVVASGALVLGALERLGSLWKGQ